MKRLLSLGILLLSLSLVDAARADTIHLKNGRQMTGIITRENPDSIELAIGIGTVKFYTNQIARVTRSAPEEAKAMADSWDAQSKQEAAGAEKEKDASLNPRNEIKGARMGDHLLVNAVINSKVKARLLVDTGASIIMLSKIKAKELGIEIKDGEKADAKLKLADGKEVL